MLMNKSLPYPKLLLIFLSHVLIVSCNGQKKATPSEDISISTSPNAKPKDSLIQPFNIEQNAIPNDNSVPLFYDGQLCHWVRNIFQDKNGNLWFATNHYGVMRYDGNTLEYFSEEDGFGAGRVNDIVEDDSGNVWFTTYGGLTKYDGESFTNHNVRVGAINNDLWSITIDNKGTFWIGSTEGAIKFDGETFTPYPIPKAEVKNATPMLSPDRITSILEDKNGILWFGTDGYGISKYDGKSFVHLTKANGLPDNNVHDIMEDSKGNIWIGTMYGGVSKYDGKSFSNFTKNGTIQGNEAGGFHEDRIGNIWFAAENVGVYKYDGKSFTNFHSKEKDEVDINGILSIFEDKEGRFWLGGWKGLFRYDGKSFHNITKDGPWGKKPKS